MNSLPLEWYKAHPFVQMWRNQDCNSFFPTVRELNAQYNVDVNRPFTISRVEPIITHYLNELARHVRKETCDKIRSRRDIAQRFGLNKTECQFIINMKTKIKDE